MKNSFYYNQLKSEEEKHTYLALKRAVENHTLSISVSNSISGEQISQAFLYMLLDSPDFFWTKGDFSLDEIMTIDGIERRIRLSYLYGEKESQSIGKQIQETLEEICDGLETTTSQETVVRSIAAWFQKNVSYSVIPSADQTIYSALVMRKSVCMGISKAITLVLRLYGIDNIVVMGTLFQEGVHAWNMVCLDDTWYHLDVAADYKSFDRMWVAQGIQKRKLLILVKTEELTETHSLHKRIIYPQ